MADQTFTTTDVAFAKIVATPTLHAWSQAYHAGKLFAVLSVSKETINQEEELLPPIGKEILNTLEEEYFTLETKNLETIKRAAKTTCEKIPKDVTVSFVIASLMEDIMYIFIIGDGKAIMKRGDKIGTILDGKNEEPLLAASGRLEHDDTIVLETASFAQLIPVETLQSSLDHHTPAEVAETLSPLVHEQQEGAAAGIVIRFHKPQSESTTQEEEDEEEASATMPAKHRKLFTLPFPLQFGSLIAKLPRIQPQWTHSKKMFISIAAILALVLLASVVFAIKKQEEAKTRALFQNTVSKAQKKYEEGTALLSLNKQLAKEDLLEAQKIIQEVVSKFPPSTQEGKKLQTLAKQIEEGLTNAKAMNLIQPTEASGDASPLLSQAKQASGKSYVAEDAKSIYILEDDGITSVSKTTQKERKVITNKKYWEDPKGIGLYLGNIYVLDASENQIRKFVPIGTSYEKVDYIKSDASAALTNAASLAIDTSAWILMQNGEVKKFTRGKQDTFSFSGLEQPLNNPTRIFTSTDTTNLYILDNGNSRIVVFNKEGIYQVQYQADVLKDAREFDIREKDKKIYVLAKEKIWEIPLK